jgi:hypothetical protein
MHIKEAKDSSQRGALEPINFNKIIHRMYSFVLLIGNRNYLHYFISLVHVNVILSCFKFFIS